MGDYLVVEDMSGSLLIEVLMLLMIHICDCLCKNPPCSHANFGIFFEV